MRLAVVLLAALSLPAMAQDVAGTWEMTEAQDVPVADDLVFTRMTFTGDRLLTTAVFLDPDDGELSARVTDDRYRQSDGQLVVQAVGSTTVLDVAREVDRLTVRDLETGVVLTLRPADLSDALDPAFVGVWAGTGGGHGWRFRFEPDGQAFVRRDDQDSDHDEPYTVAGPYHLVDQDVYRFTFGPDRLTLDGDEETIELFRVGATADVPPPPPSTLDD